MIDLTKKKLPDTISSGGFDFKIKTDFRLWLCFDRIIKKDFFYTDIDFLYKTEIPDDRKSAFSQLYNFYLNPNTLPRSNGETEQNILDFEIDSELIYAEFYRVYSKDLISESMHWHIFKSLFMSLLGASLPDVIEARVYTGSDKKMNKHRSAWELPSSNLEQAQRELEEFNVLFDGGM